MSRPRRVLTATLVALAAAAVVVAVLKARRVRDVATETADDIEATLDALDPVTRAAVIGKLSKDAVKARRA